jgi:beta-alanine degradation protein BauB
MNYLFETINIRHRVLQGATLAALGIIVAVASIAIAQLQPGNTGFGTTNISFESLNFQPLKDANGPKRAVAFGDPNKSAHGFYIKLPPQWASANHYHSSTYHAVVIDGEVVNNYEGQQKEVKIGKGGYFSTINNVNHVTKCLSKTECIIYIQMDGAFDAPPARQSRSRETQ